MALNVYQEIFCRMVASPAFRRRIVEQPEDTLDGLDLTGLERRRLVAIAAQPGMRVNTAIHKANRLTPLDQALPFTCLLLGEELHGVLERYWAENPTENLQVPAECERFAAFLDHELLTGRVAGTYLEEILACERACAELRFFTEDELRSRAPNRKGIHPLVRIVSFRHDPQVLLEALMNRTPPPADLQAGEFHLLIDCRSGEPDFRLLDQESFCDLQRLQASAE